MDTARGDYVWHVMGLPARGAVRKPIVHAEIEVAALV
jgi:hypothetical protein